MRLFNFMQNINKKKIVERIKKVKGDIAAARVKLYEICQEIKGYGSDIDFDYLAEIGSCVGVNCAGYRLGVNNYESLFKEEKKIEEQISNYKKILYRLEQALDKAEG